MAPEVMTTLIGRLPLHQPAYLSGFRRHPVIGHAFPGLIPSATEGDAITKGVLYSELTDSELKRLDWFEDEEYTRTDVQVRLDAGDKFVSTQVYVWSNSLSELDTTRLWEYEDFRKDALQNYLLLTVKPCREELDRLRY